MPGLLKLILSIASVSLCIRVCMTTLKGIHVNETCMTS